jgi:hypothetical protein
MQGRNPEESKGKLLKLVPSGVKTHIIFPATSNGSGCDSLCPAEAQGLSVSRAFTGD